MHVFNFFDETETKQQTNTIKEFKLVLESEMKLVQRGFDRLLCLSEIDIEPKPWQVETALKAMRDMRGNAILADEVGLGKTIEAGLIMKELLVRGMIKKILILVPAPLVEQWKEEMETKFNLTFVDYRDKGWVNSDLVISSMPYAARSKVRREKLQQTTFDLLIVDEAHSLKNHKTVTYKFVYGLTRKNTVLMSATPIQNDLKELFNLINILKPGHFKSRKLFAEEYISDRFRPKNTAKLKEFISEVMIRHKRSNTLVELPRRWVHNLEVVLEKEEKELHYDVIKLCRIIYERELIASMEEAGKTVLTLVGLLKQNCSSPQSIVKYISKNVLPKLENEDDIRFCESILEKGRKIAVPKKAEILLENIKRENEQCIVYTEFLETLSMLQNLLEKNGIKVVSYHGSMNAKQKTQAIKAFKEGEYQVFLATESGGQGLNLQFCHQMYNYDLPWNPMRVEQRIGRVHRFGQKNEVHIYNMSTRGTIDEYILYVLTSKVNLFEMVIGELDTIMSYMVDESVSIETRIGRIILETNTPEEIELNLRKIGDEMLVAKTEYSKDVKESNKILNEIGVEE